MRLSIENEIERLDPRFRGYCPLKVRIRLRDIYGCRCNNVELDLIKESADVMQRIILLYEP